MKRYLLITGFLLVWSSFALADDGGSSSNSTDQVTVKQVAAPSSDVKSNSTCIPGNPETSNKYNAIKWYRDSAEKNAQYNQVFNFALSRIKDEVAQDHLTQNKWGVIMDIDETSLDNTAYELHNMLLCKSYNTQSWYTFLEQQVSLATPGSVRFSCMIHRLGGKVIMVTDRDGTWDKQIQEATVANLHKVGLCFDNVVFANGPRDNNKTPRFMAVVAGNYTHVIATKHLEPLKILAYFGDNIQDFPDIRQKNAILQNPNGPFYQRFGQEFFSLPNPIYGSWEHNPLH